MRLVDDVSSVCLSVCPDHWCSFTSMTLAMRATFCNACNDHALLELQEQVVSLTPCTADPVTLAMLATFCNACDVHELQEQVVWLTPCTADPSNCMQTWAHTAAGTAGTSHRRRTRPAMQTGRCPRSKTRATAGSFKSRLHSRRVT